ncbi:MAG: DUF169 domain-containing protein [Dehalococcoidia bacterium]
MSPAKLDYSIFKKFDFKQPPIGVKFLLNRPKGIKKLAKEMAFCEMLGEAPKSQPFYATRDNFSCMGPVILGMEEADPIFQSGQVGAKDGIYKEARANRRIYNYIPKMGKGTVRYVAFSPMDKLPFEPDLLIIAATPPQAEILLRAYCYTSGKMITTKSTPVLICAWLYAYPYLSGEMNYTVTGLGFGMKARKVLPEGFILLSFPYDSLPMLIDNLKDMEWVPPLHRLSEAEKQAQFKKTVEELRKEYES